MDYGGIEAHVEAMAEGLVEIGANFTVITPNISTNPSNRQYPFPIIQTNYKPKHGSKPYIKEVRNIIEKMDPKPDLILSCSDWSGIYLHTLGIPQIVSHGDSGEPRKLKKLGDNVLHRFKSINMRQRWTSIKYETNQHVWLPNTSFALWPGFPPDEFVEPNNNNNNNTLTRRKDKLMIFVGVISEKKGIDKFEELARRNTDWTFHVYGTGSYTPPNRIPNLEFKGRLKRGDDHHKVFAQASVFFMFVAWEEAFGRTVVEALSKGTPVFGSRRGSIPELVPPAFAGVTSDDIGVLDQALKNFSFTQNTRIYNWAKESFSSKKEMIELYRRGMELRNRVLFLQKQEQ